METLIFSLLMPLAVCFGLAMLSFMAATYAERKYNMQELRKWGFGFMSFGIIVSASNWLQAVM